MQEVNLWKPIEDEILLETFNSNQDRTKDSVALEVATVLTERTPKACITRYNALLKRQGKPMPERAPRWSEDEVQQLIEIVNEEKAKGTKSFMQIASEKLQRTVQACTVKYKKATANTSKETTKEATAVAHIGSKPVIKELAKQAVAKITLHNGISREVKVVHRTDNLLVGHLDDMTLIVEL